MDVLILRTPDLLTMFVNNCIQIWVSVRNFSAWRGSEEVWEEVEVNKVGFVVGGRRLYGGGGNGGWVVKRWGWAPNNVFG